MSAFDIKTCFACASDLVRIDGWHARCPSCGLYVSNLEASGGTGVSGLETLRRENFEALLDRFQEQTGLEGLDLLEVGCSSGLFLQAARNRGMNVVGVEPEIEKAAAARALGFDVYDGYFPAVVPVERTFDVIVFNDVFEHLPDPVFAAQAVDAMLNKNGHLVVNLPNSDGVLFRVARVLRKLGWSGPYERLWQIGFPSPHITYFNDRNLRLLVEKHTDLRQFDSHTLTSVHRTGIRARVGASYSGIARETVSAVVWIVSFIMPLLKSDITVSSFRKP